MTLNEANQTLAGANSSYMIDYTTKFDYSLFDIEYSDLVNDFFRGDSKRLYSTATGHGWTDLLEFIATARKLCNSIVKIARSECTTNNWSRYQYVFSKLDSRFSDYCLKNTIIWY